MAGGYLLSPAARIDLIAIGDFIAQDNLDAGYRFVDRILQSAEMLSRHPNAGRPRSELGPGLRGFSVANHIIFYRLQAETVLIVRILSTRLDIETEDFL